MRSLAHGQSRGRAFDRTARDGTKCATMSVMLDVSRASSAVHYCPWFHFYLSTSVSGSAADSGLLWYIFGESVQPFVVIFISPASPAHPLNRSFVGCQVATSPGSTRTASSARCRRPAGWRFLRRHVVLFRICKGKKSNPSSSLQHG